MPTINPMAWRLQISGTFLVIGLLIEAICLLSAKPIAFVLLVAIGGLVLFAGVTVYLFSIVSTPRS
jgi:predicted membrane channel-forming protein YqfA (hemolysin III family)